LLRANIQMAGAEISTRAVMVTIGRFTVLSWNSRSAIRSALSVWGESPHHERRVRTHHAVDVNRDNNTRGNRGYELA
jgi:hypothetical protein